MLFFQLKKKKKQFQLSNEIIDLTQKFESLNDLNRLQSNEITNLKYEFNDLKINNDNLKQINDNLIHDIANLKSDLDDYIKASNCSISLFFFDHSKDLIIFFVQKEAILKKEIENLNVKINDLSTKNVNLKT